MALATLVAAASSASAAEQVPVPYPAVYPTAEEFRVENAARARRLDVDV
jgi:hypothetical protein